MPVYLKFFLLVIRTSSLFRTSFRPSRESRVASNSGITESSMNVRKFRARTQTSRADVPDLSYPFPIRLSIIVQVDGLMCPVSMSLDACFTNGTGRCRWNRCSMLSCLTPYMSSMDVFDVFLPASSLYTAVLPHDFRPAASKGESSLISYAFITSRWILVRLFVFSQDT